MKYLVYSDVHGNLPAFEQMINSVTNYDCAICLGDLVNYGPWSNECVDLAMSLKNSVLILGNHECAFSNAKYNGSNSLVKKFTEHCLKSFDRFAEIKNFLNYYDLNSYRFIHTFKDQYVYRDSNIVLDGNYVIGHSHHQFLLDNTGFKLYCAGSVGQNRKYINVINYLLYDSETGDFDLKQERYSFEHVIEEMKIKKFPKECIDYYLAKDKL